MKLLTEVLECTDRKRFEIIAYSYDAMPEDAERVRARAAFERFEDVAALTEPEIADKIRDDRIHVLVDLKGYTGGSRLGMLKYRPAPIQVNWLGYPGTYGMAEVDYVIADRFIVPEGAEGAYNEAVVRLPDSYQPNRRRREVVDAPTREMVGLPEGPSSSPPSTMSTRSAANSSAPGWTSSRACPDRSSGCWRAIPSSRIA